MIDRDDLPETPDWILPPRTAITPAPTIATAELDSRGTE